MMDKNGTYLEEVRGKWSFDKVELMPAGDTAEYYASLMEYRAASVRLIVQE